MPTKPVLGLFLWAGDVNFTTGPPALLGTATKVTPPLGESDEGWKANQKPPAQHFNFVLNSITQWTEWVRLGSFSADLDAHLMETDASGEHEVAALRVGNTAAALTALVVEDNSGAVAAAADITGSTGFAVLASNNAPTTATIRALQSGADFALEALNLGTGGGLESTAAAGARALDVTANGGVLSVGLFVDTDQGSGIAVFKTDPDTNPVAQFHQTGGVAQRATIFQSNQGDPTIATAGDLWTDHGINTLGRGQLKHRVNDGVDGAGAIGIRTLWSTVNGIGHTNDVGGATLGIVGVFTQIAIDGLDTGETSPGKPAGNYYIWWSFSVESDNAADTWEAELRINGTPVQEDSGDFQAVGVETRGGGFFVHTATPSTLFTITIFLRRLSGAGNLDVDDAFIGTLGAFELVA